MKKKSVLLGLVLFAGMMTGCGSKDKEIYFLNFKPEVTDAYNEIVEAYEEETGVKVKVITAAAGEYESTLKSEMAKKQKPAIFQINGPVGYESWKDYCSNLIDTELYKQLGQQEIAVTSGAGVYGIPYVVEGYGIIYNDEIMQKYFALSDKKSKLNSASEIHTFLELKEVVEDMTLHKEELGIDGVFASTSMASGNSWRWQSHLANLPFWAEFKENKGYSSPVLAGLAADTVEFKYEDRYKRLFDLYIENSCTDKQLLGDKNVDDSVAEFAMGRCAMMQNGNWAWEQISKTEGSVVNAENIGIMPVYMGLNNEVSQGLCVGTENYLAVNAKVSEEEQQLAIDFLEWLYTGETGKQYVVEKLQFVTPFKGYENYEYSDPLANQVVEWMNNDRVKTVPWVFVSFPSVNFKNEFGDALLRYCQGDIEWEEVVQVVKTSWEEECKSRE